MNEIKISVILPVYNVEEYIEESLQSILAQTLDGIEVILVDDESPDGSSEICKAYVEKYENFSYYRQKNSGAGIARNTGASHAKGEYIAFMDPDDIIVPDAYEKLYRAAVRSGCDVTVCRAVRFSSTGEWVSSLHRQAFRKICTETTLAEDPDLLFDTVMWNKLIKREFWEKHNIAFPPRIIYQDMPVAAAVYYHANRICKVYDVLYKWRSRDQVSESATQKVKTLKNMHDRITSIRLVRDFFDSNVSEKSLFEARDFKWLYIDMKTFMNNFADFSPEEAQERMEIIRDFIIEEKLEYIIEKLPAIYREEYRAVLDMDADRLIRLRRFERDEMRYMKSDIADGKVMGYFPEELVPETPLDLRSTIERRDFRALICDVKLRRKKCVIRGHAYLPFIPVTEPGMYNLKGTLFNSATGERIEAEIEERLLSRKFSRQIPAKYRNSGFVLTVNEGRDELSKKLNGDWYLLIGYDIMGMSGEVITAVPGI